MQKRLRSLFVVLILLCFYGCATPRTRVVADAATPKETLALLVSGKPKSFYGLRVIIHSIDEQPIKRSEFDGSAEVELPPGKHTVAVGYVEKGEFISRFSNHDQLIVFDAEASHHYEARVNFIGQTTKWFAEIVDLESGKKFLPEDKTLKLE